MSEPEKLICGVVMPISSIDGLPESHWVDVRQILHEAIEDAGFTPNLVSNAEDVGIIQKRIIENLYDNPVVVCDVSGKNPNVMFELGLRLAFDKPTIIVKDDKTTYSFDTSPIEHLGYPRDLRFSQIVEFKLRLTDKIKATHKASSDKNYTTFLKHFGEFTVVKLDKKEVPGEQYILEELRNLSRAIMHLQNRTSNISTAPVETAPILRIQLPDIAEEKIDEIFSYARTLKGVSQVHEVRTERGRYIEATMSNRIDLLLVHRIIEGKIIELSST